MVCGTSAVVCFPYLGYILVFTCDCAEMTNYLMMFPMVDLTSIHLQKGQRTPISGVDGSVGTRKMVEDIPRRCPSTSLVKTLFASMFCTIALYCILC